jgi:hypothetical protein
MEIFGRVDVACNPRRDKTKDGMDRPEDSCRDCCRGTHFARTRAGPEGMGRESVCASDREKEIPTGYSFD